jgi:hypothetical protein
MAGSQTYVLAHPFERVTRVAGGSEETQHFTEVQVRRLNGADMRWLEAQADKPGTSLGMVGRLTGLAPVVVDMIDAEDIAGIAQVIEGFLPPSLRDTSKVS